MVIIKTNQTPLLVEMDRSKVLRKENPLGINGLIGFSMHICVVWSALRFPPEEACDSGLSTEYPVKNDKTARMPSLISSFAEPRQTIIY